MNPFKKLLGRLGSKSRVPQPKVNIKLGYDARTNAVKILDLGGYQSRNKSTIHLLLEGLNSVRSRLKSSFEIDIYTCDALANPPNRPHFAYCSDQPNLKTIAIPDFIFWGWQEVGIEDYEKTRAEILLASLQEPVDSRLFWIGNPETHPTRKKFLALATEEPRIDANGMQWVEPTNGTKNSRLGVSGSNYISLPDHCKYRYLLDLQGVGYSGRVKLLLLAGRTLFLQERRWKEFFYSSLTPYKHYIPVKEDLSDLSRQLDWAEANPEQAHAVAINGQSFALDHLSRDKAVEQIGLSILSVVSQIA